MARQSALQFNADVEDAETMLLDPARRLIEKGTNLDDVAPCLAQVAAELAFWRRVLVGVHRDELRGEASRPNSLVRYLLS